MSAISRGSRAAWSRQYPDGLPVVMDPFCGGGSTLVEAQRLGLRPSGPISTQFRYSSRATLTEMLPQGLGPLSLSMRSRPKTSLERSVE